MMSLAYTEQSWAIHAVCADAPPDSLFVRGAAQRQARTVCFSCPVRLECLADALQSEANFGVWGGMTERERRSLLRAHPHEDNWLAWLLHSSDGVACKIRNASGTGTRRKINTRSTTRSRSATSTRNDASTKNDASTVRSGSSGSSVRSTHR